MTPAVGRHARLELAEVAIAGSSASDAQFAEMRSRRQIVQLRDTEMLFPADAAEMELFARTAHESMQEDRDG